MAVLPVSRRFASLALSSAFVLITGVFPQGSLIAQEGPLRPGEAFVTRFSGIAQGPNGAPVIDPNGTVGSIIDLRAPGRPPQGQHWIDEPQRSPVTAAQVGQVFGVVLDDANPPNIYVASTSAFGLHHLPNGSQWMPGMWGSGGPGAIYRLNAAAGYAPSPFAQTTLNGRTNTGPALGNLAYDRFNKQLFATDLETGMIHRIRAADGADLGVYDHGTQGRPTFLDAETGQPGSLPPIAFDPSSHARVTDCPTRFDSSPQCWNLAASGRRVWGIAVHRDPGRSETRVYYAVWSGPAFDQSDWNQAAEDDKRNSVWSVRLAPDGGFAGDVRREFVMPDFFTKPQDIARAGYSQPVSDITFSECGPRPILLIAERGGIRNLGLAAQNPFATPHEARALRYELDQGGSWRPIGRYDVGFYDRKKEGEPFLRANCEGGIAFAPGYNANWTSDQSKPDQFVWITGHSLCSAEAPCNLPAEAQAAQPAPRGAAPQPVSGGQEAQYDESEVHGLQGLADSAFEEVAPQSAFAPYPQNGVPTESTGPNQSYMIDTDINIDANGQVIEAELTRNDATKIGDVAIFQICEAPASYAQGFLLAVPAAEPPILVGHPVDISHALVASHGRQSSHYRYGSHNPYWSHNRFRSHNPYWSHNILQSHNRARSHYRYGSHDRQQSHRRNGSHERSISHWRTGSHDQRASHGRTGSHDQRASHARTGSHDQRVSHTRSGSQNTLIPKLNTQIPKPQGHTRAQSRGSITSQPKVTVTPRVTVKPKVTPKVTIKPKPKTIRQPTVRRTVTAPQKKVITNAPRQPLR